MTDGVSYLQLTAPLKFLGLLLHLGCTFWLPVFSLSLLCLFDLLVSFLPLSRVAWALKAAFAEILYVLSSCKGICACDKPFCFALSGVGEVTVGSWRLFILTPGV